jgi:alcohol dehydrogenase class IV
MNTYQDDSLSAGIFRNARLPELVTGPGAITELVSLLQRRGIRRVCLVTGKRSYEAISGEHRPERILGDAGITAVRYPSSGEPSPDAVDRIRDAAREDELGAVVAVGGGSVLDTGKAVAAMLRHEGSVEEYLEGVGDKAPSGSRVPLIAVPTTAGTGSEATKNAVISRTGAQGYKKSLRHAAFVPDSAILDPELSRSVPADVTAASGLDAVTQLLEASVSAKGNPFTAMCALDGLSRAGRWLERAVQDGRDLEARAQMAYAAYLSGAALASAGLGVVHGAAGVLGGMRPVPHGVVCGTLLQEATVRVIDALRRGIRSGDDPETAGAALQRYTRAAEALTGEYGRKQDEVLDVMTGLLGDWIRRFRLPGLSAYGFTAGELESAAARIKMKETPAELDSGEISKMLAARL